MEIVGIDGERPSGKPQMDPQTWSKFTWLASNALQDACIGNHTLVRCLH